METDEITAPIIARLELEGFRPERRNAGMAKRGGRYISLSPAGTPDIHVTVAGRCVHLECKVPKTGRLSPVQKLRHEELRRQGAIVEVVRSVDEAMAVVRRISAAEKVA